MSDPDTRSDSARFMEMWFRQALPGELVEVRPLKKRNGPPLPRTWFATCSEAIAYVERSAAHGDDVYIGVLARGRREGGADAIASYRWVFADVDYGTVGHAKPAAFATRAETLASIRTVEEMLGARATFIVDSGGGFQPWWALKESATIDTWTDAIQRLALALGADMSATDPPRILRVPGTWNCKVEPRRATRLVEHRSTFVDLARVLALPAVPVDDRPSPPPARLAPRGDSPFGRANDVPIGEVLGVLGVEMHREGTRVYCACPVHGGTNTGQMVVGGMVNGATCFGDCAGKFYTPVDVVVAARSLSPRDAVTWLSQQFGFEGFASRATITTPDDDPNADAPPPEDTATPPAKEPPAPAPKIEPRLFADLVESIAERGEPVATGLSLLDRSLYSGGIVPGEIIGIGGAPAACKTMLAMQLARNLNRAGCSVLVHRADERATGLVQRVAQSLGYRRADLRAKTDDAKMIRAQCADEMRETFPGLACADMRDGWAIDTAATWLVKHAQPGVPSVLVIDSIQRAARAYKAPKDTIRERVELAAGTVQYASDNGVAVIFTSEVSRAYYRDRAVAKTLDPMAAFKESGDIEYLLDDALVLSSVKDEPGIVHVELCKVRDEPEAGRAFEFRLKLDRVRAELAEIDLPADDDTDERAESEGLKKIAALRIRILEILAKNRNLGSGNAIAALLRGDRNLALATIREMVESGDIGKLGGKFVVLSSHDADENREGE